MMRYPYVKLIHSRRVFPPGPRDRFPGEQLLALHRDPLGYLERLARRYGDLSRFRVGKLDVYFFNHPDLIKQVLVTRHRALHMGIAQRQARRMLGNSLITSEGAQHVEHRRLIQPSFHRSRIIGQSRSTAEQTARWCAARREGEVVETASEFWKLTLNIVAESLFSASLQHEIEDLFDTIKGVTALASPALIYFADWLEKLPLPLTQRFEAARARLDATIYRLIAEHRADPTKNDLLTTLMETRDDQGHGLNDTELRDETLTLLTAGHGTTSIALMWVFYLLSQHPEVEQLLHREVDTVLGQRLPTVHDLARLPYTRAVLAEALRLYPPAWAQDREAAEDVEIGGYVIPKGSVLLVSQWVTHRDARFFPEPTAFRPERWLGDHPPSSLRDGYFPFGAGPRVCIGEDYAWMNGMLILATIAQRLRLRFLPGHRVELFARTGLGSKYGMRMICQRRSGDWKE